MFEACTGRPDHLKVITPRHGPDFVTIGQPKRYEAWQQED
jgi:hypothetical protein